MSDPVDAVRFTVEDDEGSTATVEVPAGLIDRLAEPGDTPADVVGDVAVMSFAGRAHALVHHTEGEPDPDLEAAEERMLDLFEERFGVSYAEATGHSH